MVPPGAGDEPLSARTLPMSTPPNELTQPGTGRRALLLGVGALVLGGGCAGRRKGPCVEEKVERRLPVRVHASTRLNRDQDLRSLPTHLHLYTVRDVSEVRSVSFDAVWTQGDGAFPKTLLASERLVVHPGEVIDLQLTRVPEGDYLVAVGIFRQPAGTSWRAIHRLPPIPRCRGRGKRRWPEASPMLHLIVEDNRLRASDSPPPPPPETPEPRKPAPPPQERVHAPRGESK